MKMRMKQTAVMLLVLAMLLVQAMPAFAASGRWVKSGSRYWYRHADSSYTSDGWEKIGGKWYRFDKKGWMQTGWVKDGGSWYYLNKNGEMRTGWLQDKGKWYYLDNSGAMIIGWRTLPFRYIERYQDTDGLWYPTGNSRNASGTFYFDGSGAMATGLRWIDGDLYCFDKDFSFMRTNYSVSTDRGDYYFTNTGKAAVGWHGNCYYYQDRTRAKDAWIDGKYLDLYGFLRPSPGMDFDYEINYLHVFYDDPQAPKKGIRMYLVSDNTEDFEPLISFFKGLKETDREVKRESDLNYTKAIYKFDFRRYDSYEGREIVFVYPYAGIATCEGVNYEIDIDALNEVINSLDVH